MRKMIFLIFVAGGISCAKNVPGPEINIRGIWENEEVNYNFSDELIVTTDGVSENYVYYVANDTIYLDYGLPFKIENLTESELVLSKNDRSNFYLYEFYRIDG